MPSSRLSIQWKITLLAGLCLLAVVTLLVGASLYQSTRSAEVAHSPALADGRPSATTAVMAVDCSRGLGNPGRR